MVYRTTSLGTNQPSPMETLHGFKAHSELPMGNTALYANGNV